MTRDGMLGTEEGNEIAWTLHGAELPAHAPVVLYLHGFKGFKDWGFVPELGRRMAEAGIRVLAMNFSHNGIGSIPDQFTEPERFTQNTFSLELSEARQVLMAVESGELPGIEVGCRIGLIGHSRGGGIALLAAAGMACVRAVCTWASVSTYARYPAETLAIWEKEGVLPVVNSRTGQVLHIGWGLHRDLEMHGDDRLNIAKATQQLGKPLCILHGSLDDAVPVADAEAIHSWADPKWTEYHLIQGANHVFGAQHPFTQSSPAFEQLIVHTRAFFHHNLSN